MTVVIEYSDVLQACVTVLIGVLIFLTLERKFEKKDLTSNRLEYDHQRYRLKQELVRFTNQIENIDEKLQEPIDPEDKMELRVKRDPLTARREEVIQELTKVRDLLSRIKSYEETDNSTAARYEKIKDREDIVNSIAVAFLSACVIFMIFWSPNWKADSLDYSNLSRGLFATGIMALVFRVFLYHWDVKSTKLTKQQSLTHNNF
jgi:hypothetical protein